MLVHRTKVRPAIETGAPSRTCKHFDGSRLTDEVLERDGCRIAEAQTDGGLVILRLCRKAAGDQEGKNENQFFHNG